MRLGYLRGKRQYEKPWRSRAFHACDRFSFYSAGIIVLNKDAPAITTDVNIDLFTARILSDMQFLPSADTRPTPSPWSARAVATEVAEAAYWNSRYFRGTYEDIRIRVA